MTSATPAQRCRRGHGFQVSSFQLLKLKQLHCDDLHIILSLSAVQIYDYFIYLYSILITVCHKGCVVLIYLKLGP